MTTMLAELGGKLADRWAAALLAPGLLFVAAVACAYRLGQRHALDLARLPGWVSSVAADPASRSPGAVVFFTGGVLAASIAAGVMASAAGRLAERAWLVTGQRQPASGLRAWRHRRWMEANAQAQDRLVAASRAVAATPDKAPAAAAEFSVALARRDAICLVEPERPTWIADRLRATDLRVHRAYGLDLGAAWPRLWSLLSAELRADLSAAQDACASAARLQAWGLLYLTVSPWWWPAALVAVPTVVAGWVKARAATGVFASLAESAVDLHGRDLALRLGVGGDGRLTREVGEAVTELVRKDHPPTLPRPRRRTRRRWRPGPA
jgi:hypothetical protein